MITGENLSADDLLLTANDSSTEGHSDDPLMAAYHAINESSTSDDPLMTAYHAINESSINDDLLTVVDNDEHSLSISSTSHESYVQNTTGDQSLILNGNSDIIQDSLISTLSENRKKHGKSLVIAHINVNGLGEKRDYFRDILVQGYIDVLCVTESKLGAKYVITDLHVNGYKAYRKDKTSNSGGLHVWVRGDIPHDREHHLEFSHTAHIESMVLSMTVRKEKVALGACL